MYGILGTSLFYLGRRLLKLSIIQSSFLAIFAIFQVPLLRTTWDLHKDIFALTNMMFALSMLAGRTREWKSLVQALVFVILAVAADRMIGSLLCLSLAAYAVMTRRREVVMTAIVGAALFCTLMVASYGVPQIDIMSTTITNSHDMLQNPISQSYTPANLMILLAVTSGLIAAPAAIGFFAIKNVLLKIPLSLSLVGSFSWLLFPENSLLVADRWIILTGVFLSIFAGYGIIHLVVKKFKFSISSVAAGSIVIGAFAVIGVAYSLMPADNPFMLFSAAGAHIQNFGPLTMQFNSVDIQDNKNLLSAIAWLNKNTEPDAVVVGEAHWRGFMELYLADRRAYLYSDDPAALAAELQQQGKHTYLISAQGSPQTTFTIKDMRIR
jgi:hypothetical protein